MVYDPEIHHRKAYRLKGHDYSKTSCYFVTICTQFRKKRFGNIINGEMVLNDAGTMIDEAWRQIPDRFSCVVLDAYQIMPDHIHGIIQIISPKCHIPKPLISRDAGTPLVGVLSSHRKPSGSPFRTINDMIEHRETCTRPVPSLSSIIGTFKSITTLVYGKNVRENGWPKFDKRYWQQRFHERIIHNEYSLNCIRQYIRDNPSNATNPDCTI